MASAASAFSISYSLNLRLLALILCSIVDGGHPSSISSSLSVSSSSDGSTNACIFLLWVNKFGSSSVSSPSSLESSKFSSSSSLHLPSVLHYYTTALHALFITSSFYNIYYSIIFCSLYIFHRLLFFLLLLLLSIYLSILSSRHLSSIILKL